MKEMKSTLVKIGSIAFIIGVVIALLVGVFGQMNTAAVSALIVLGLIVGFLNVTTEETTSFLLAAIALAIVSNFGSTLLSGVQVIGPYLQDTLRGLMVFIIPATIIVALKAIYNLAKDE